MGPVGLHRASMDWQEEGIVRLRLQSERLLVEARIWWDLHKMVPLRIVCYDSSGANIL